MNCFLRAKIVDPSGSIRSGRLWAGGEPDMLRRPQAYSRYRVLCIRAFCVARSTTVTMLVALADKLNTASRSATLQPPLAYCVTEFGRPFAMCQESPGNWRMKGIGQRCPVVAISRHLSGTPLQLF